MTKISKLTAIALTAATLALSGCNKTEFTKQDFYKKNSIAVEIYPLGEVVLQDLDGDRKVDVVMPRSSIDHNPLYITKECKDSTIVYNAERAATMPENVREALTRVFQDIQEAGIEIAKAKNAYKEQ